MPDISSLYPAPPQPARNALMDNPLGMIGALNQLQQLDILQKQAPALSARPAVDLQSAQIEQQEMQRRIVAGALGTALSGIDKPSSEDVYRLVPFIARTHPNIPASVINATADVALKEPRGIKYGAGLLLNMGMSPAEASSRTPMVDQRSGVPVSVPVTAANLAGALPTGLPAGGGESAGVMQADLARARNYSQEIFPWTQALGKMEELQSGGQTFGPGSKGRQELESFAYALSPTVARWAGVDPEKISKYAEVEKYLTQGLQQRANNMGPHTNEGLATAATGTPNVHITDLAGIPLVKAAIALRRMEHVQTLENEKGGGPNYTANVARWSAQQDPRAYMLDLMEPDQIKALQKSLKGNERAKFNASLRAAVGNGVLSVP